MFEGSVDTPESPSDFSHLLRGKLRKVLSFETLHELVQVAHLLTPGEEGFGVSRLSGGQSRFSGFSCEGEDVGAAQHSADGFAPGYVVTETHVRIDDSGFLEGGVFFEKAQVLTDAFGHLWICQDVTSRFEVVFEAELPFDVLERPLEFRTPGQPIGPAGLIL